MRLIVEPQCVCVDSGGELDVRVIEGVCPEPCLVVPVCKECGKVWVARVED